MTKKISIIKPDDWHSHLREGDVLDATVEHTTKVFERCVAMPNLSIPITEWEDAKKYKNLIEKKSYFKKFEAFIPCYLIDDIDINKFKFGLEKNHFFGAKLYPSNSTTNSKKGITKIENTFKALEVLEKTNKPLLIHGEKIRDDIDIFDREKYFIDEDLSKILKRFSNLKIVLEHVSSKYGADFISESPKNIAATITLHHLLLTKKDVFNGNINPHNYCMPVVKNESDLISLRNYACSGNSKFFIGTDSAPHDLINKENTKEIKPGIYTAPVAVQMYTRIFEEENSLSNLEKFLSINGPTFYNLPINSDFITLIKDEWTNDEFTSYKDINIKNFFGGKKINWKVIKYK